MNLNQLLDGIIRYLPLGALLISLGALWISVISLRRTNRFQRYEYAPRLELVDELTQFSTPHGDQVYIASGGSGVENREVPTLIKDPFSFAFQADIVNKGEKTTEINRVFMDYGSSSASDKMIHRVISGRSFLAPGEKLPLELLLSPSDIEEAKSKHSIDECIFLLRVSYKTVDEPEVVTIRKLGGYKSNSVEFVVNEGNTLS